jgi:predicted O-linked N-acetylglucosamine transferase (SPINDLY family)
VALQGLKRLGEALVSYEHAIAFTPDYAEAYFNCGHALQDLQRLDEALVNYECAMTLNPDMDYALGFSLYTKMQLCLWDELPKYLNELIHKINIDEKVEEPFPILAFIDNPELHRKTAKIFANKKYPLLHVLPKIQRYPQHEKIRVGYFSADFHNHATMHLMAGMIKSAGIV